MYKLTGQSTATRINTSRYNQSINLACSYPLFTCLNATFSRLSHFLRPLHSHFSTQTIKIIRSHLQSINQPIDQTQNYIIVYRDSKKDKKKRNNKRNTKGMIATERCEDMEKKTQLLTRVIVIHHGKENEKQNQQRHLGVTMETTTWAARSARRPRGLPWRRPATSTWRRRRPAN